MYVQDSEEFDRLDMQHAMLKMSIEGLYAPRDLVRARLSPRDGPAPGVLDLGCGSGLWCVHDVDIVDWPLTESRVRAIQMAEEFEHSEVLGIDGFAPIIHRYVEY